MPKTQQFETALGRTVYASGGDALGRVDAVYHDDDTGEPEWLGIATAGRKRLLVPVRGAEERDDGFTVPYTADQVEATPAIGEDEVSQETERLLYEH